MDDYNTATVIFRNTKNYSESISDKISRKKQHFCDQYDYFFPPRALFSSPVFIYYSVRNSVILDLRLTRTALMNVRDIVKL